MEQRQARGIEQDELQKRLDRVIGWINNCDQKASILLAFVAVVFPLLFSSDFAPRAYKTLFPDFLQFWEKGEGEFSVMRALCFFFVLLSIWFVGKSVYCLLKTLSGRISISDFKDQGLPEKSLIFFGSISKMEYQEYKKALGNPSKDLAIGEDLASQLYVNSKICADKFDSYNKALSFFLWGMLFLCLTYVLLLLV